MKQGVKSETNHHESVINDKQEILGTENPLSAFERLPHELHLSIMQNLSTASLGKIAQVSKTLSAISEDDTLWKNLLFTKIASSQISGTEHKEQSVSLLENQQQEIDYLLTRHTDLIKTHEAIKQKFEDFNNTKKSSASISAKKLIVRENILNELNALVIRQEIEKDNTKKCLYIHDKITRLPAQIIDAPDLESFWKNLETLSLDNNKLKVLPHNICKLFNLKELRLYLNQLINVPNTLVQLTSLELLDLSHNQLTTLLENMDELTKLYSLEISYNGITELPKGIEKLALSFFHITNNYLSTIPSELEEAIHGEQVNDDGEIEVLPITIETALELQLFTKKVCKNT